MFTALALLFALAHASPLEPTCITAFGQTACGYDCRAAYGQVRCAPTPYGRCHAGFGTLRCGPESVGDVVPSHWPRATCRAAYGDVACGYNCVAGFGEVACAAAPWGACVAGYGGVSCSATRKAVVDAELLGSSIPQATCVQGFGQRACGWNCVASRGTVTCADSPWDTCAIDLQGRAHCSSGAAVVR
ncbi:MAG: hypothetical protein EA397_07810 [Deltaproteobacteria bacterium]|nr:MAG: hypothetical protein EA397_07810 [Deltaproteobacteria bacterium]